MAHFSWTFFFVIVFSPKNIHGVLYIIENESLFLNRNSQVNESGIVVQENEFSKRQYLNLNLAYISNPSSASVNLMCRVNKSNTFIRIICPALDHEILSDEENQLQEIQFSRSKDISSATDDGFTVCNRTLRWKTFGNFSKISCVCKTFAEVPSNIAEIYISIKKFNNSEKKILHKRTDALKYTEIKCHVTGWPKPHVTWYKDGKPLNLRRTRRMIRSTYITAKHGRVLKISRANPSCSGNYRCLSSNMAGGDWGRPYTLDIQESLPSYHDQGNVTLKNPENSDNLEPSMDHPKGVTIIVTVLSVLLVLTIVILFVLRTKDKEIVMQIPSTMSCFPDQSCNRHKLQCSFPSPSTLTLLGMIDQVPQKANARYFVSGLVDHNGGQLYMDNTGANLIVPENALKFGKSEVISIGLVTNEKFFPSASLKKDESLLSSVVMCGPHGIRFKKPVILTLPHYAGSKENVKKFRVLCSDTPPDKEPSWSEVFNSEKESNKDCYCSVDDKFFTLFITHFSWFCIPANCPEKLYCLSTYRSSSFLPPEVFNIRIYCFPDSREYHEEVERNEREKLHGITCHVNKPITIYQNGGDLNIYTSYIEPKSWKFLNNYNQGKKVIQYSTIWNCSTTPPVLQFDLEHNDGYPKGIYCNFLIVQEELEMLYIKKEEHITVSATFPLQKQGIPQSPTNVSFASVSSGYNSSNGRNTCTSVLPTALKQKLTILLRTEANSVAEKLHVDTGFIKWLEKESDSIEYILEKWESTQRDQEKALHDLAKVLLEMGRYDAADEVYKYCTPIVLQKRITTV